MKKSLKTGKIDMKYAKEMDKIESFNVEETKKEEKHLSCFLLFIFLGQKHKKDAYFIFNK